MRFASLLLILLLGGCMSLTIEHSVSGGGKGASGALFATIAAEIAGVLPAACPNGTLRERTTLRYREEGSTNELFPETDIRFKKRVTCND